MPNPMIETLQFQINTLDDAIKQQKINRTIASEMGIDTSRASSSINTAIVQLGRMKSALKKAEEMEYSNGNT